MAQQIQLRGGTLTELTASTDILATKEIGIITDSSGVFTGQIVVGDGTTTANALTIHNIIGGGSGTSDHGSLTGLGDDDHSQYHNDARGDARYYQLSTPLAAPSDITTAIDALKEGVPVEGDTLNKLYVLIQGLTTGNLQTTDIDTIGKLNAIITDGDLSSSTAITTQITALETSLKDGVSTAGDTLNKLYTLIQSSVGANPTIYPTDLILSQNITISATTGILTIDGTNYPLLVDQGARFKVTAPASNTFTITFSGAGFTPNGRSDGQLLSQAITLEEGTRYFYFYRFVEGIDISVPSNLQQDVTAPIISNLNVVNIDSSTADIQAQLNEPGVFYWAAYPDLELQRSKADILAGTGAIDFGSITTIGGIVETNTISGLSVSTSYKIHYYAEDEADVPNETAANLTSTFTTSASSAILNINPTIWLQPSTSSTVTLGSGGDDGKVEIINGLDTISNDATQTVSAQKPDFSVDHVVFNTGKRLNIIDEAFTSGTGTIFIVSRIPSGSTNPQDFGRGYTVNPNNFYKLGINSANNRLAAIWNNAGASGGIVTPSQVVTRDVFQLKTWRFDGTNLFCSINDAAETDLGPQLWFDDILGDITHIGSYQAGSAVFSDFQMDLKEIVISNQSANTTELNNIKNTLNTRHSLW